MKDKTLIDDGETAAQIIYLTRKLGGIEGKMSVMLEILDSLGMRFDAISEKLDKVISNEQEN